MVSGKKINEKYDLWLKRQHGKCPKCGTKNPKNAAFCQECGKKFSNISLDERKKRNNKILVKALAIFVCLVAAIILYTIIFPVTALNIDKDTFVTIDNQTTSYLIKGKTEANSTVKINSKVLNLNNVEVNADELGNFNYLLTIPLEINQVDVEILAKVPNKSQHRGSLIIKRTVDTSTTQTKNSTPAVTQPQASGKYDVGGSKFDMPDEWTKSDTGSDSDTIFFKYLSLTLVVEKLPDQGRFDSAYNDAAANSQNYEVSTQEKTIEGVPVKIVLANDLRNTDNFKDYFFTKNGKYYHIGVVDASNWKSISTEKIDNAVSMIIKTIQ
ncbi:MAG: zinc-ribbon domain-containing protein [Methanobacterium sp.]